MSLTFSTNLAEFRLDFELDSDAFDFAGVFGVFFPLVCKLKKKTIFVQK